LPYSVAHDFIIVRSTDTWLADRTAACSMMMVTIIGYRHDIVFSPYVRLSVCDTVYCG